MPSASTELAYESSCTWSTKYILNNLYEVVCDRTEDHTLVNSGAPPLVALVLRFPNVQCGSLAVYQHGLDLLRISRESLTQDPMKPPVQVRAPLAPLSVNPAAAPSTLGAIGGAGEPVVN